jgi:hypothetical protein
VIFRTELSVCPANARQQDAGTSGTRLAKSTDNIFTRKERPMPGPAGAYAVAIFAMLLSASAAVAVVFTVRHLDPPEVSPPSQAGHIKAAA